ncbi:hypothetical protein ACFLTB_00615 [Chloroflexota bacterium]
MDDNIRSAREIALEKAESIGEATDEERLQWKYFPQGETLAARYLKEDCNLVVELRQYEEDAKKYVVKGAMDVLTRNFSIPKNDIDKKNNRRIMDGVKLLKSDKVAVENVYSKIRYLFNHYEKEGEEQRQQAYQSLKTEMETQIQQAMQQQMNPLMGTKIDVEKQPQFQQEWRKMLIQLEAAYISHLNEYKQELIDLN